MNITFLGTGGGRFATISQKRMTGGFRIDDFNGKNFHVDPGPGALARSHQFGINPTKIDGIFISHSHTDHYTDAEVLIEAMTRGMTKDHGIIIGSRSVFEGFQQWGPSISKYHRQKSEQLVLASNKIKAVDGILVRGTKTVHGDPTCVGFQMESRGLKISYTSDTSYFENLSKYHKGSDILIASVLRPGTKSIRGHMCRANFTQLVKEVKPKLAIMTHFGFKMLNEDPAREAEIVAEETGIRTVAAFDGMQIIVNDDDVSKSQVKLLKNQANSKKDLEHIKNDKESKSQTRLDTNNATNNIPKSHNTSNITNTNNSNTTNISNTSNTSNTSNFAENGNKTINKNRNTHSNNSNIPNNNKNNKNSYNNNYNNINNINPDNNDNIGSRGNNKTYGVDRSNNNNNNYSNNSNWDNKKNGNSNSSSVNISTSKFNKKSGTFKRDFL